jgi:hypothetical protein
LTGGAAALAGEPLPRQRRLDVRRLDQIVAGVDRRRDAVEKRRTRVRGQASVRLERMHRGIERAIDMPARRFVELRQRATGGKAPVRAIDRLAGNQAFSYEHAGTGIKRAATAARRHHRRSLRCRDRRLQRDDLRVGERLPRHRESECERHQCRGQRFSIEYSPP